MLEKQRLRTERCGSGHRSCRLSDERGVNAVRVAVDEEFRHRKVCFLGDSEKNPGFGQPCFSEVLPMPELPEVETMVRGIRPHCEGRRIAAIQFPPCSRKPISITPDRTAINALAGHTLHRVGRLGKRVILELDNHSALVVEPRMTGLLLVTEPPTAEHLRVVWELGPAPQPGYAPRLLFWDRRGLGTLSLLNPAEYAALHPTWARRTGHYARRMAHTTRQNLPTNQSRTAGPDHRCRNRQSVRQRNSAPRRDFTQTSGQQPLTTANRAASRKRAARASASHSLRRFNPERRHLSQRPQSGRQLSKSSSRLQPRRHAVSHVRWGTGASHSPGTTLNVLLSRLSALRSTARNSLFSLVKIPPRLYKTQEGDSTTSVPAAPSVSAGPIPVQ